MDVIVLNNSLAGSYTFKSVAMFASKQLILESVDKHESSANRRTEEVEAVLKSRTRGTVGPTS